MKVAYFDCFAGASGNMILGSLVDAGLPLERLVAELRRLPVGGWELTAQRLDKRGLAALYLDANVPGEDGRAPSSRPGDKQRRGRAHHHHHDERESHHHHEGIAHRRLADVLEILKAARFPQVVEHTAERIYRRLAAAEGAVHGKSAEQVVFHEVGQVDAILDIAGAALGLHLLAIERAYCSALPCGKGRVKSAHGEMPSPAPATLELLRGFPTYAIDLDAEFVTPTGAAILTEIASFEPRPPMTIHSIGYGSGSSNFPFPNVLRVMIGETASSVTAPGGSDVVQIETNIDDMDPRFFELAIERIFQAGALDVWTQSAAMKKGRPGLVLCALAPADRESAVTLAMLAETTTIGVRSWPVRRTVLERKSVTVDTSFGPVRVKMIEAPEGSRARPEYEDCRRIAQHEGLPLGEVVRIIERDVARSMQRP